jgi:transcriptional regulator with XRE-family HTH domain
MRLADYLSREGISDTEFAAMIGVSRMSVGRYRSGERRPEWDVLARIVEATRGEVTANDFLGAGRAA